MNEFFRKPIVKILMLKGEKGEKGETGTGTPTGGKTGQYLQKKTDADYDYRWADITTVAWDEVTGKPDAYPTTWDDVTGKPDATTSASGLMSAEDKSKLDNLQVGGRNYIRGSDIEQTGDGTAYSSGIGIDFLNHNLGKDITISIRYTAENWAGKRFGFEFSVVYDDGTEIYYGVWITKSANGDATSSSTVKLPTDKGKVKTISSIGALYVQETSAGTVTVYKPKIELGTVATDWTPAPESVTKSFTLTASSWSSGSYTISDALITATSNQEIIPAIGITADQLKALQNAMIVEGGQSTGSLTLTALGTVPTIDIPIRVIFRGTI